MKTIATAAVSVLLLAALLLAGPMSAALAYDGAVTFQGIPWGSSVEEAIQILNEKGFLDPEWGEYAAQVLVPEYGTYIKAREEINAELSSEHGEALVTLQLDRANLLLAEDSRIAGYPVHRLELTFVRGGEETRLVGVGIDLAYESAAEAAADLRQKLTGVYGDSVHAEVLRGIIATDCWLGTGNSIILLYVSESGEAFTLDYGTLDAEAMIAEALENRAPANRVDSTDVDGL